MEEATDEQVGFSAQQAVEKSIKSVLSRRSIAYRKTHDLEELMALLDEHQIVFPGELRASDALTSYAAQFRYDDSPEGVGSTLPFDRRAAVRLATLAVHWATELKQQP